MKFTSYSSIHSRDQVRWRNFHWFPAFFHLVKNSLEITIVFHLTFSKGEICEGIFKVFLMSFQQSLSQSSSVREFPLNFCFLHLVKNSLEMTIVFQQTFPRSKFVKEFQAFSFSHSRGNEFAPKFPTNLHRIPAVKNQWRNFHQIFIIFRRKFPWSKQVVEFPNISNQIPAVTIKERDFQTITFKVRQTLLEIIIIIDISPHSDVRFQ